MRKFSLLIAFMAIASWANAQDWFISANLSKTVSTSENAQFGDMFKGAPGVNLYLGCNFNRYIGARLNGSYAPVMGHAPKDFEGITDNKYTYQTAAGYVDVLLNLVSVFNSNRIETGNTNSLYLLAGFGLMKTGNFSEAVWKDVPTEWDQKYAINTYASWNPVIHFGLAGNIKLTESLGLGLEMKYNLVSDKWNGINCKPIPTDVLYDKTAAFNDLRHGVGRCNKLTDGFLDFNVGINWYFGHKSSSATKAPVAPHEVVKPTKSYTKDNNSSSKTAVAPVTYEAGQRLSTAVSFYFDFSDLSTQQKPNMKEVAKYLKANPNARLIIHGYADKEYTDADYISHNEKLAKARAKVVYDSLVNEYGIAPSRLSTSTHSTPLAGYKQTGEWIRAVEFEVAE